jgi:hypothetical protein
MMSSDDDEDELLTLLSPASHAAQFPRRFSDDEDDDDDEDSSSADELVSTLLGGGAGSSGRPAAAAAASPQGARAAVATNPLYGADNLQRQWSTTLSDGDSSLSDDSDDSEEDVGFDEAEAERMRKEYETYQRERAERAKAAEAAEQARTSAVQAYVVGGPMAPALPRRICRWWRRHSARTGSCRSASESSWTGSKGRGWKTQRRSLSGNRTSGACARPTALCVAIKRGSCAPPRFWAASPRRCATGEAARTSGGTRRLPATMPRCRLVARSLT